jgi:hypothetical protein
MNREPALSTTLQQVRTALTKLVHLEAQLYGRAELSPDFTANKFMDEYKEALINFNEALENYATTRVFIALKQYIDENKKAA